MVSLNDIEQGTRVMTPDGQGVLLAEVSYRSRSMVIALTKRGTEVEIIEVDDEVRLYWPDNAAWHITRTDKPLNGTHRRKTGEVEQ